LRVLSSLPVLLSIEKPEWDLELTRILNDSDEFFNFIRGKFTRSLVNVDFGLFANEISKPTTKTGDLGKSENNVSLSFDVGVENPQNVLELGSLHQRRRPESAREKEDHEVSLVAKARLWIESRSYYGIL